MDKNIKMMECTICGKETKYVPNKKLCKICKRAASNARRIKALKLPENITKSVNPAKMLNAVLTNESVFSFSFVRHPYTR